MWQLKISEKRKRKIKLERRIRRIRRKVSDLPRRTLSMTPEPRRKRNEKTLPDLSRPG